MRLSTWRNLNCSALIQLVVSRSTVWPHGPAFLAAFRQQFQFLVFPASSRREFSLDGEPAMSVIYFVPTTERQQR